MSWLKYKKTVMTTAIGFVIPFTIFMSIFLHEAWGDSRYVLREEARIAKIQELNMQLAIKDTEILFTDDDDEKEKLRAIRALFERERELLKEKPAD